MKYASVCLGLLLLNPLVMGQVSMSGEGSVKAVPDMAAINFSVVTKEKDASKAMKTNSKRMSLVIEKAAEFGIQKKDISTTGFEINPVYVYDDDRKVSRLVGYSAHNNVSIIVRDIKNFGKIIDGLVDAGANKVDSLQFGFSNIDELKNKARLKAVANARDKAELYVKELGSKLGNLKSISESARYYGYTNKSIRLNRSADSSTPIEPGSQAVSVSVNVTWDVGDNNK